MSKLTNMWYFARAGKITASTLRFVITALRRAFLPVPRYLHVAILWFLFVLCPKITGMIFNSSSGELITAGLDNTVRFTKVDTCDFSTSKSVPLDSEPASCAMSADGSVVVACEKEVRCILIVRICVQP